MDIAIAETRRKLGKTRDDHLKVDLTARLSGLQRRRQQMTQRLERLAESPDSLWANLKAQIELEWFGLVQDVEERVGRLL